MYIWCGIKKLAELHSLFQPSYKTASHVSIPECIVLSNDNNTNMVAETKVCIIPKMVQSCCYGRNCNTQYGSPSNGPAFQKSQSSGWYFFIRVDRSWSCMPEKCLEAFQLWLWVNWLSMKGTFKIYFIQYCTDIK